MAALRRRHGSARDGRARTTRCAPRYASVIIRVAQLGDPIEKYCNLGSTGFLCITRTTNHQTGNDIFTTSDRLVVSTTRLLIAAISLTDGR